MHPHPDIVKEVAFPAMHLDPPAAAPLTSRFEVTTVVAVEEVSVAALPNSAPVIVVALTVPKSVTLLKVI